MKRIERIAAYCVLMLLIVTIGFSAQQPSYFNLRDRPEMPSSTGDAELRINLGFPSVGYVRDMYSRDIDKVASFSGTALVGCNLGGGVMLTGCTVGIVDAQEYRVYIGYNYGVDSSVTDGSNGWRQIATITSDPGGTITIRGLHAVTRERIFAFDIDGVVYETQDQGYTWTKATETVPLSTVVDSCYVGSGTFLACGTGHDIAISEDYCVTWATRTVYLADGDSSIYMPSITHVYGNVVLCCSTRGVYVSTNGGQAWSTWSTPSDLGSLVSYGDLDWIRTAGTLNNVIISVGYGDRLYRCTDGNGSSWVLSAIADPYYFSRFEYVGMGTWISCVSMQPYIAVSTNGGESWEQGIPVNDAFSSLDHVVPMGHGNVLITGTHGVWRNSGGLTSGYGGGSTPISPSGSSDFVLRADSDDGVGFSALTYEDANGVGYACKYNGELWRSTDNFVTHSVVATTTGDATYFTKVASSSIVGDNLGNFYTSADGGLTWAHVATLPDLLEPLHVAAIGTDTYIAWDTDNIWRTTNTGSSWSQVFTDTYNRVTLNGEYGLANGGIVIGDSQGYYCAWCAAGDGLSWTTYRSETYYTSPRAVDSLSNGTSGSLYGSSSGCIIRADFIMGVFSTYFTHSFVSTLCMFGDIKAGGYHPSHNYDFIPVNKPAIWVGTYNNVLALPYDDIDIGDTITHITYNSGDIVFTCSDKLFSN